MPEAIGGAGFRVEVVVVPGVVDGDAGVSSTGFDGGVSKSAGTGGNVRAREGAVPQPDSSKAEAMTAVDRVALCIARRDSIRVRSRRDRSRRIARPLSAAIRNSRRNDKRNAPA